MREIVLDTETTGLDPKSGHRVVEIGCIELFNHMPTGAFYHQYVNPQRDMPEGAFNVHGLSEEFLQDFPQFDGIVDGFLEFIQDSPLIIHNAAFDLKFLNAELTSASRANISTNPIIDTLLIARKKFPGSPASLDALCRRFGVDNAKREKHGALLDSEILAEVYIELLGGKQTNLFMAPKTGVQVAQNPSPAATREAVLSDVPHRKFPATAEELKTHSAYIEEKIKNPLWNN